MSLQNYSSTQFIGSQNTLSAADVIISSHHRIHDTEVSELKVHIQIQVSVHFLKKGKWTDSEVGNNPSIGNRVPNPRMLTSAERLPKVSARTKYQACCDWLIKGMYFFSFESQNIDV